MRELERKSQTFITPFFAFGFVLIGGNEEAAVQRNQAVQKSFETSRHCGLSHTGGTEHDIALQYQRVKFLHRIPWEAVAGKPAQCAASRITTFAWLDGVFPESDFGNFKPRFLPPGLYRGAEEQL